MAKRIYEPGPEAEFKIMMQAVMLGVTPEEYAEFYAAANKFRPRAKEVLEGDIAPAHSLRGQHIIEGAECLKDAKEKTLTLKVQMQDVTKPPMWRELKVPADFTFYQLHKAIQAVCGFENAHLWQFQRKAYDPSLQIGLPSDSYDMGLDEWTHDARTTGLTAFLAEKGQKLVYVYDFGDDWIFTVSVTAIGPREGDMAVCTRWKSDMQPMEDSGGVWSYINMRDSWEKRDAMNKRQKKELAAMLGYDSYEEMKELISDTFFNIEFVNEQLAEI